MRVEIQKTITNTVDNGELSLQDLEWVSGGQAEEEGGDQGQPEEKPEEESGPKEQN
ncbi:hypothetical protein H6G64_35910 [Calothrix sp. FACHB-156]|nr:hypothetical protein [Calothrix sp. FACHB-156]